MSRAPSLLLVPVLALLAACGGGAERRRPDVVLIVVDTLRADRLGTYGSGRPTSPVIDRLARQGAVLLDNTSQSSWTRPSMVSLMQGRYITDFRDLPLEGVPTLAEALRSAGYRGFAAVGNGLVSRDAGFDRGFEYFDDRADQDATGAEGEQVPGQSRGGRKLVRDLVPVVAEALEEEGEDRPPFLVYLHLMDPHYPYVQASRHDEELPVMGGFPLAGWQREMYAEALGEDYLGELEQESWEHLERLRGLYDQEVRTADDSVRLLLKQLEPLGLLDNTIIALVADHGEMLYDQPSPEPMRKKDGKVGKVLPKRFFYRTHGVLLDRGLVGTPFLLQGPGVPAGVRLEQAVENIDLVPTLLELCDVGAPEGLHGKSLLPWLRGEESGPVRPFVYSFCLQNRSVREVATGWKLTVPNEQFAGIPGFEPSLHRLDEDPLELDDRHESEPEVVARLMAELDRWAEEHPLTSNFGRERSAEERETLRALGYADDGPDDGLGDERR